MSDQFKALVLNQKDGATTHEIATLNTDALPEGDVLVQVEYSGLNYKDALAITGKGKIVRSFPMVPGVDLAGVVLQSDSPAYKAGDRVVLTGWSVGERFWGGYSQIQRVRSEWLVPMPDGMDSRTAMALGTAGFTAMLCVMTLTEAGIKPEDGTVLVTGAAGGVGSVAVAILKQLGFKVAALVAPHQAETHGDYLRELGASEVLAGPEWSTPPLPLEKQKWAAAVDTVGSVVLARALAETFYGGAIASCGLAGGADLPTTVMPFILRAVRLLGVDSVMCPVERRKEVWNRIVQDFNPALLQEIAQEAPLEDAARLSESMLAGQNRGRVLINLQA
jgi:acrylyl-CoA reductase (NADPH)